MDNPWSLACCTAFRLSLCRNVGFLSDGVTCNSVTVASPTSALRSSSGPTREFSSSGAFAEAVDDSPGSGMGTGAVGRVPSALRRVPGLGGASWEAMMCPSCCTDSWPSVPPGPPRPLRRSCGALDREATAGCAPGTSRCCPWLLSYGA